jgi:hypothetical protein
MKSTCKIILILIGCIISLPGISQKSKLYLESNKTYPKGSIYIRKSLVPVSATQISLVNDTTFKYTDSKTGTVQTLDPSRSGINYVKMKTGTKAGEFALYGGALMCLSSIYGVLSAEKYSVDEYGETSGIKWFPFVAGFTVGGAAIGGLIGVFCPKYKNFYIKSNTTLYKIEISPFYYSRGIAGLGLHATF